MLTEEVSFGAKLKSTRENMGISVQEAASRLHLSPRFITTLENENLLTCSLPLTYLRGYLRSYSRLLGLPESELAPVLEKLDPKPIIENPQPQASASLALSFPLENKRYYTHIATGLISFMLLTSITTWWYLHANKPVQAVLALKEPLIAPEPSNLPHQELAKETEILSNQPLLEATSSNPVLEPAKMPEVALDPSTKKPVTLATAAAGQNLDEIKPKPLSNPKAKENDDDGSDE